MITVTRSQGVLWTSETQGDIPQNNDLTVNYDAYLEKIESVYNERIKGRLKNDLTQIY